MPFHHAGELSFYQFAHLQVPSIKHAIFTRRGGVSPAPWRSLNFGSTVGDARERVFENKCRALQAVGRSPHSIFDVWQVHGCRIVEAQEPRGDAQAIQADGIITNRPAVTLLMRFADCVPILLHDPTRRAVGIVHAGWLGTVRKAAMELVNAMQRAYGSKPADLIAGIGPSIGPDHYPVGREVIGQVIESFGEGGRAHLVATNGEVRFDLWSANQTLLRQAGVERIEMAGICTACHLDDWYSHRAERGNTGRFGAYIALHG